MTRTMTRAEHDFIINALRVAAQVYNQDAAICGAESLKNQFLRQAQEAKRIADDIEDGEIA